MTKTPENSLADLIKYLEQRELQPPATVRDLPAGRITIHKKEH